MIICFKWINIIFNSADEIHHDENLLAYHDSGADRRFTLWFESLYLQLYISHVIVFLSIHIYQSNCRLSCWMHSTLMHPKCKEELPFQVIEKKIMSDSFNHKQVIFRYTKFRSESVVTILTSILIIIFSSIIKIFSVRHSW